MYRIDIETLTKNVKEFDKALKKIKARDIIEYHKNFCMSLKRLNNRSFSKEELDMAGKIIISYYKIKNESIRNIRS